MTCPLNRLETMIARGVNLRARSNLVLTLRDIKVVKDAGESPETCLPVADRPADPASAGLVIASARGVAPHRSFSLATYLKSGRCRQKPVVHMTSRLKPHKNAVQLYHKVASKRDAALGLFKQLGCKPLSKVYWARIKCEWGAMTPEERAEFEQKYEDESAEASSRRTALVAGQLPRAALEIQGLAPVRSIKDRCDAAGDDPTLSIVAHAADPDALVPIGTPRRRDSAIPHDQHLVLSVGAVSSDPADYADPKYPHPVTLSVFKKAVGTICQKWHELEQLRPQCLPDTAKPSNIRICADYFKKMVSGVARDRTVIPQKVRKPRQCLPHLCLCKTHPRCLSVILQANAFMMRTIKDWQGNIQELDLTFVFRAHSPSALVRVIWNLPMPAVLLPRSSHL